MKILFLTDNFPPESNAPASRTYEHCLEWVKKGVEVTVITCAPNFPTGKLFKGYKNKLIQREVMDGIKVIRVWSYITPNRGLGKRILDYLSFCIMSFFASLSVKTDLIVATSPQLFTAVSGCFAAFFKRKKWVMEVRDLWPDSIQAVEAIEKNTILKILDRVVMFLYKRADKIIVVTDSFKKMLIKCKVEESKIEVVKNGVYMHKYIPSEKPEKLVQELGLGNKFVITYIGTLGMAHGLNFILDCFREIQEPDIHLLLIGEGAMKSRLVNQKASLALENVSILDGVPKEEVSKYIALGDVSLINLRRKNTFTKVIPSKIFENAAMGKPILLGVEGEAKEIVESFNAGLRFEPENKEAFIDAVSDLYQSRTTINESYGGGAELAKHFDRQRLALEMLDHLLSMKEAKDLRTEITKPT